MAFRYLHNIKWTNCTSSQKIWCNNEPSQNFNSDIAILSNIAHTFYSYREGVLQRLSHQPSCDQLSYKGGAFLLHLWIWLLLLLSAIIAWYSITIISLHFSVRYSVSFCIFVYVMDQFCENSWHGSFLRQILTIIFWDVTMPTWSCDLLHDKVGIVTYF